LHKQTCRRIVQEVCHWQNSCTIFVHVFSCARKELAQFLGKFFLVQEIKNLQNSCASVFSCATLAASCYFIIFYFIVNWRSALIMAETISSSASCIVNQNAFELQGWANKQTGSDVSVDLVTLTL